MSCQARGGKWKTGAGSGLDEAGGRRRGPLYLRPSPPITTQMQLQIHEDIPEIHGLQYDGLHVFPLAPRYQNVRISWNIAPPGILTT